MDAIGLAQLIAISDNKHDFNRIFKKNVFKGTIANNCGEISPESEDKVLEEKFNIVRDNKNRFKFKYENPNYSIGYNDNFENFINNINNPIAVIDMDLGGFMIETIKNLDRNAEKRILIYNGPEVKYDPAGKISNIKTSVKKALGRIGQSNDDDRSQRIVDQISFTDLSRNSLHINPKDDCLTPFESVSQHFFTKRDIFMSHHNKKAYSLIEQNQPQKYVLADKNFAEKTVGRFNIRSLRNLINAIRQIMQSANPQNILRQLRERANDIITPTKNTPEHYIAKRLGDAAQAIACQEIDNSILVTHDRLLLAFALSIGVSRIVFTHPSKMEGDNKTYPVSIFQDNRFLDPEIRKRNTINNIKSLFNKIQEYNIRLGTNLPNDIKLFTSTIQIFNENTNQYADYITNRLGNINILFNNLNEKLIRQESKIEINNGFKELIRLIMNIMPYLKIYSTIKEYNINNDLLVVAYDILAGIIDGNTGYSPDDLNNTYNTLKKIYDVQNLLDKINILKQQQEIVITNKELRFIQLVRTNRPRRERIKNIFSNKEVIESRIESQLKLSLLNEFKRLLRGLDFNLENFNTFLQICRDNVNIEGHGYVTDKFIAIIDNQVGRGGIVDEGEDDDEEEGEKRDEELINRLYAFEEYSICLFNVVFKILALDDEKYNEFNRYYPEQINEINRKLEIILLFYYYIDFNDIISEVQYDIYLNYLSYLVSILRNPVERQILLGFIQRLQEFLRTQQQKRQQEFLRTQQQKRQQEFLRTQQQKRQQRQRLTRKSRKSRNIRRPLDIRQTLKIRNPLDIQQAQERNRSRSIKKTKDIKKDLERYKRIQTLFAKNIRKT